MMKNYFLKISVIVSILLITTLVQAQVEFALQEGFENGIPDTWTQENVSGNMDWTVEQGGNFPNGVAEGSWRAVLRNDSQQTQNFVTKLISPVMKLSSIYQPILIFSHAQEYRAGDVDELRVYYRDAEDRPWVLLEEYTERIRTWKQDTIRLIGVTDSYQIAFEGKDNFGYGIVLDNVQVRSFPICTNPEVTLITEPTAYSFRLNWVASFDSDRFAVKISNTPLDDVENATNLVLDTIVDTFNCLVENLSVNTTYYCYVKAYCSGESSDWSAVYSYRTKATASVPYEQNFDRDYNQGYLTREDTWTWMNSWPEAEYTYCPHINSNVTLTERSRYSRNGTTAVAFTGSNNATTAIPAGEYAYIASPELIVNNINTLQVSFWGTAYTYVGDDYASSLIVGVIEDPEDITTFTPVDTVRIKESKTFEEFIVPLDSYEGNGKYIVLISYFGDKRNIFYVDDVVIEEIPACKKITEVKTADITDSTAVISCNRFDAPEWELIITTQEVKDMADIEADKIIYRAQNITTDSHKAEGLPESTRLYVYARANCNNAGYGSWSNAIKFRTACKTVLPMYFGFETEEGTISLQELNSNWNTNVISPCIIPGTNATTPPYIWTLSGTDYARTGKYALYLISNGYIVFPAVDNIQDVQVSFWIRLYGSTDYWLNTSKMVVGVMSDPYDISTFDSVAVFEAKGFTKDTYEKCQVIFSNYQGEGKHIAFMELQNQTMIDDVLIELIPECPQATGLVADPQETSAKISWNANGVQKFRVLVDVFNMTDTLHTDTYQAMVDTIIEGNSLFIDGLSPITNYYYTILSLCGDSNTSDWQTVSSFKTTCLEKNPLPYSEDFEKCEGKSTVKEIPECWETTFISYTGSGSSTTTNYYPYIITSTTGNSFSGSKALHLGGSTSSPRRSDYVILPEMEVTSVKELQISFMLKQYSANYNLEVGIVSNTADTSSFVPVKRITSTDDSKNIWREIVVTFDEYEGEGKNIMLRVPGDKLQYNYIDDVVVDYIQNCIKPSELKAKDITPDSATLYWEKGSDEVEWELIVLTTDTVKPENASQEIIAFSKIADTMPFIVYGLEPNTRYYYYLRSICDTDTTGWTFNYGEFRTECISKTVGEMGVETFEDDGTDFDCWTVGVQSGTTAAPSRGTHLGSRGLYMFNSTASNGAYAIMPEIDIDSISRLQINFLASSSSTIATNQKSVIVGVITDNEDLGTFVPLDTIVAELNNYNQYLVRFDNYKGDSNGNYGKRVMFYSSKASSQTNYIYIDNISFDTISDCMEPTRVYAESIGINDVVLAWDSIGSNYRVKLSTSPLTKDLLDGSSDTAIIICDTIVNVNRINIAGLEALQEYYMYVQTICDQNERSIWSFERSFITLCPPSVSLPYFEDFDSYGTGNGIMPSCWNAFYSGGTVTYPRLSATYNNTLDGKASLEIYTASTSGYYTMVTTPRIDVEDISDTQISFDVLSASATTYQRLIVGLTKNPDNLSLDAFLPIDTICIPVDQPQPLEKAWYKYKYDLSYLASDTISDFKYVVFAMARDLNRSNATSTTGASGTLFIDNLEVELIPACQKPENLTTSMLREDSFTFSWSEAGNASAWNVQYGISGFEPGNGTIIPVSGTSSVIIPGLDPQTKYDIYVQADCGDGDLSRWAGPVWATTTTVPVTNYPYICGFEDEVENAKWDLLNGEAQNAWYIADAIAKEGNNSLYISNDEGVTPEYNITSAGAVWASRVINLETGMYKFSFDWTCYGEGTSNFIRAGLLPADVSYTPSSTTTQGIVSNLDGTKTTMTGTSAGTPKDWIGLEGAGIYKLNLVDTTSVDIDWRTNTIDVIITDSMAGYYNLVFYWRNNGSTGRHPNPSAVIDNVVIEIVECPIPIETEVVALMDTMAVVQWKQLISGQSSWIVKVLNAELPLDSIDIAPDSIVVDVIPVNSPYCVITGLDPSTTYYTYIQAVCNDITMTGDWVQIDFTTICSPQEVGLVWTFEEEGGYQTGTSALYLAPDCWIVGNKNSTSYTYIPYKIPDTGSYTYSYSNGGQGEHSLRLYSTTTYNGAYAIMPSVDADLDTLQLRFFARAAYAKQAYTEGQGYQINTTYTSSTYAYSVIVGTVTMQKDINTFVPIDTIVLSTRTTAEYANEENDWLFDEIVVPLKGAAGKNIAFLSEFGKNNYVYLDNVVIEKTGMCDRPTGVEFTSIKSQAANISWVSANETETWVVTFSTDKEQKNIVRQDTVNGSSYTAENLSPNTTYYVGVQLVCGDMLSRSSVVKSFTTAHSLIFRETFATETHCPAGWGRYSTKFESDVIATTALSAHTPTVSTGGWIRTTSGYGFDTAHQVVTVYNLSSSTGSRYWFVTPAIELPEEKSWLNFDLALTSYDSPQPISGDDLNGDDDIFMVIISDDGGLTWKKSNATTWNNDGTGDYIYNNIPATGEKIMIDLSQYAGKVISVAFYVESTIQNAKCDIHLDNVQLNRFVHTSEETAICEGYDYKDLGFDITHDNLKVGENKFTRYRLSSSSAISDSIIDINITVSPLAQYFIDATVCEGEIYDSYDFIAEDSGTYKRKLPAANGCDSVAVLNLSLIRAIRINKLDTICQGVPYVFNNKEYTRSGEYVDTLKSVVTGCDSIVTLFLKVNEALESTTTVIKCFGETYTFGDRVLTQSGIYKDTLHTAIGCDSIVILDLTIKDEIKPTIITAFTCPGEPYTGHGFSGIPPLSGDYENPLSTPEGCDSLVVLRLTVLDADTTTVRHTITVDQLEFTYYGKTYPVGTPAGVYSDTINVTGNGDCDGVIIAILTIEESTGLGNSSTYELSIIPTVIHQGESVKISTPSSEVGHIDVEVYDMLGQCIYTQRSASQPLEISAFPVTGTYLIKAVYKDGKIMYGRVIVR